MAPIPAGLKRVLVPIWNHGHHTAYRLAEYADAIRARRVERCSICGRVGLMLYRRRVIPPRLAELWGLSDRQAIALAHKESCDCAWCGGKLRARRLASVLLELYPVGDPPKPVRSIAEWVRQPSTHSLRVAEINHVEGLHEGLVGLSNFLSSDYEPGMAPGAMVNGVRSEDLTQLTYADERFDLVITSETLEHVPDLQSALAEVWRVLAPGGRHVFTIPVLPGTGSTFARARLGSDGQIIPLGTMICHPGGDVGYPVFTEFGADLGPLFGRAGFDIETRFGPLSDDDFAQVYVSRKRAKPAPA